MAELYLPDASNWIGAFEAGGKARMTRDRQAAQRAAGGLMTSGDYRGAAAAVAPYDLETGAALTNMGVKADEQKRRTGYAEQVAAGHGDDAIKAANAGGDFTIAKELADAIDGADERQKKKLHDNATRVAEIVAPLGDIPESDMAGRKAYIAQHRADLIGAGYSEEQVDGFVPSNQNLAGVYTHALGFKEYIEKTAPKVVGDALIRTPLLGGTPEVLYEGTKMIPVPEGGKLVPVTGGRVAGGGAAGGNPAPGPAATLAGDRGGAEGPRGLRNNNPLNLEATVGWDGMTGSDGRYAVFSTPEAGWAAADRNLQTYATKHGLNTVAGIVNRWAPPSENDTSNYAATVAGRLGVDPVTPLNMSDPVVRRHVLEAMAEVENGQRVAWGQGGGQPAAAPTAAPVAAPGDPPGTIYGNPKPAKEMVRPATAAEKQAVGIAPDVPAQRMPDGEIKVVTGMGASMKRVPAKVASGYSANNAAIKQIDEAIAAIRTNPGHLGLQNFAGDEVMQRLDPKGVSVRAAVSNIGSLQRHDRSGAAVTAAETPILKPFIPAPVDRDDAAITKLTGLRHQYENVNSEIEVAYGEDQGYTPLGQTAAPARSPPPPAAPKPAPKPAARKAAHQMSDAELKAALGLP